jgi:hypothetical protein
MKTYSVYFDVDVIIFVSLDFEECVLLFYTLSGVYLGIPSQKGRRRDTVVTFQVKFFLSQTIFNHLLLNLTESFNTPRLLTMRPSFVL